MNREIIPALNAGPKFISSGKGFASLLEIYFMELVEEISFIVGLLVSFLFYQEYKRVEKQEEKEELVDTLLSDGAGS